MNRKLVPIITFLFLWSPYIVADDAADVRATIERHYAAIHANDIETVVGHHLKDFTMYFSDGTVLWESDWAEVSDRRFRHSECPNE